MIALIQRVKKASVSVDNNIISSIDKGFLILLGVFQNDTINDIDYLVSKIINLRSFSDENDKMNLDIKDICGSILVVSQFTLCASLLKGRRPSFEKAKDKIEALEFYKIFVDKLKELSIHVETGCFGKHMEVSSINDGPVTFILDSNDKIEKS